MESNDNGGFAYGLGAGISSPVAIGVPTNVESLKYTDLRRWWEGLRSLSDTYTCLAIFLILPTDNEAIYYLNHCWRELDQITGPDCVVFSLNYDKFQTTQGGITVEYGERNWKEAVKSHIKEGYSVEFARFFNVRMTHFPSLLLFNDIDTPQFIAISLKDMKRDEIREKLREVFSIVQEASAKSLDPIIALNSARRRNNLVINGKRIVSTIRGAAERTMEMAMEAWFNSMTKP
jgi:hypothetical protein